MYYDYKTPLGLPADKIPKGSIDFVLLDPPFLSDECFIKVCQTVRHIAKKEAKVLICSGLSSFPCPLSRCHSVELCVFCVFCAGLVMKDLVGKIFKTKECVFHPHHEKNLSNDFRCFTNYESDVMKWVNQ